MNIRNCSNEKIIEFSKLNKLENNFFHFTVWKINILQLIKLLNVFVVHII